MNLNFTDEEIARAGDLLTRFLRSLERSCDTRPVFPQLDRDGLAGMLAAPFPQRGLGIDDLFREIDESVLPNIDLVLDRIIQIGRSQRST